MDAQTELLQHLLHVRDLAMKLKDATLAHASHRVACNRREGGCLDENECDEGARLWMAALDAEVNLFNALNYPVTG